MDLLSMPLDCDINISIDVELGTKTTSISLYRMTLAEVKKLKEQFQIY